MSAKKKTGHHCNPQTTILRRCHCGQYHLHYKYVMLTIPQKILFRIMEECYAWDEKRTRNTAEYGKKAMKLMVGLATMNIEAEDFDEFNAAIQQGASEALDIETLIRQAD